MSDLLNDMADSSEDESHRLSQGMESIQDSDGDDDLLDFGSSHKNISVQMKASHALDASPAKTKSPKKIGFSPLKRSSSRNKNLSVIGLEANTNAKVTAEKRKADQMERLIAKCRRERQQQSQGISARELVKSGRAEAIVIRDKLKMNSAKSMAEQIQENNKLLQEAESVNLEELNKSKLDESQRALLAALPKDLVDTIRDLHPEEQIFTRSPNLDVIKPTLKLTKDQCVDCPMLQLLVELAGDCTKDELADYLCGRWIDAFFSDKDCPHEVADWLFELILWNSDEQVLSQCFSSLCLVFIDKPTNLWKPNLKKLIFALLAYGADSGTLELEKFSTQTTLQGITGLRTRLHEKPATCSLSNRLSFDMALNVITLVLKKFNRSEPAYKAEEIKELVMVLLKTSTDRSLLPIGRNLTSCLGASLDAVPSTSWITWKSNVGCTLSKLISHHHTFLFIIRLLPGTSRSRELTEAAVMEYMSEKFNCCSTIARDDTLKFLVKAMQNLSQYVAINDGNNIFGPSDYYLLHTFYQLVDSCVYNEPYGGVRLEQLKEFGGQGGLFMEHSRKFKNATRSRDVMKIKELLEVLKDKIDSIVLASKPNSKRLQRKVTDSFQSQGMIN